MLSRDGSLGGHANQPAALPVMHAAQGAAPQCIALVATLEGSGAAGGAAGGEAGPGPCIGTLDVRLLDPTDPFASAGWPDGVPLLEPSATPASGASSSSAAAAAAGGKAAAAAAYVSNVVVAPAQRGRGLGRALVSAGLEAARQQWGVGQLYCHVELDNEVGRREKSESLVCWSCAHGGCVGLSASAAAGSAEAEAVQQLGCALPQVAHACSHCARPRPLAQAALALYRGAGFCQLGEPLPPTEDGLGEAKTACLWARKNQLCGKARRCTGQRRASATGWAATNLQHRVWGVKGLGTDQ